MVKNYTKSLLVALAVLALGFSAYAEIKFTDGDLKYKGLEGYECAVIGLAKEIEGELVIPEKVKYGEQEYTVVRMDNYAFQDNKTITSVVASGALREIGYCSFEKSVVASVTLDGVRQIEAYAFNECPIEELVIPASVLSIDNASFNCTTLKNLVFQDGTEPLTIADSWGSINCEALQTLYYGRPFNENDWNFRPTGTTHLTSIAFGPAVTFVPGSFAREGSALTEIVFGGNETSIGDYAFQSCSALPALYIPDSCKSVGYCSFEHCSSLKEIYFSNVETFGAYAFDQCSPEQLIIPASVRHIDNNSFNCPTIKNLIFEDSYETLEIKDAQTSINCESLETLYFGRPFNENDWNFRPTNTENLTTITFGPAVTFVPGSFALNGSALTKINFSGNETQIGDYAFQSCSALPEVVLPKACTHVGYCSFEYCSSLKDITLNNVETFGAYAFDECSPVDLFIPSSVKVIENNSFNCPTIENLVFEDSEEPISIKDGWTSFNCSSLKTLYYGRPFNENDWNLRPNSTSKLTTVTFGPAVTFIPDSFANNGVALTEINFSGNETKIGSYAFQNCLALPTVELPEACKVVGYCAFEGCKALVDIDLNNVETLEAYAFDQCSPVELFIPACVRKIDNASFNCPTLQTLIFEDGDQPLEIKDNWTSINNESLVSLYYGRPFNQDDWNYRVSGAKNLKMIEIGKAATFIPASFASQCTSLTQLRFGGNEQILNSYCFQNCEALEVVTLPEACKTVGYCAFENCTALNKVFMYDAVEGISSYAFAGTALESITCQAVEPPVIENENSFSQYAYQHATVYVPEGCYDKYKEAPYWKKFYEIDATGIQDIVADNIDFELLGNDLYINSDSRVSIYNISGKLVYTGKDNVISLPAAGAYIISANGKAVKVFAK